MEEPYYKRLRPYPGKSSKRGPNGRPFCRECGEECPKYRHAYCSDKCADLFAIPRTWSVAVHHVNKRDKGVCALCGRDAKEIKAKFREFRQRKCDYETQCELKAYVEQLNAQGFHLSVNGWNPCDGSLYEIDHIIPVVEGGGGCGLQNLRTLCVPCHKAETKALAARRAIVRKVLKEGKS